MRTGISSAAGATLLALLLPQGTDLAGQQLPVREAPDPRPRAACPAESQRREAEPSDRDRAQARKLARSATEAALLGDPEKARDLLRQATERNPRSAELAYRRARAHEELDERDSAVRWYCRYLALAPAGEDATRVRDRLEEVVGADETRTEAAALDAFREGVARLESGRPEEAEQRFDRALRADPDLAAARYNRGLARGAAGRSEAAVRDLRAYLEARPDAPDRERVEEAIRFLEDSPAPHDPTRALLLGALVPGAGHFYVNRPVLGSIFLGVAGAGVAAAFYEKVEVTCLAVPDDGVCPDGQVHTRTVERPALVPGLVTAAVAAGISAITAHAAAVSGEGARLRVASDDPEARTSGEVRILAPDVASSSRGVDLRLVRLGF